MESNVYVAGGLSEGTGGGQIQNYADAKGRTFIPFFSSIKVLRETHPERRDYFILSAKSLLQATLGQRLILNPDAEYAKEFLPAEVDALLTHGAHSIGRNEVVPSTREVYVGPPPENATLLIDVLTGLFKSRPEVIAAYIGTIRDISMDGIGHLAGHSGQPRF